MQVLARLACQALLAKLYTDKLCLFLPSQAYFQEGSVDKHLQQRLDFLSDTCQCRQADGRIGSSIFSALPVSEGADEQARITNWPNQAQLASERIE